ncbi:anti-sigma factor family protein [Deinococcus cellulosilyticus]|uniref:Zinc-finger domain-containing protein n=1 Tax=Deinococcus cellulosilyticus (strain DSM 18568 / NBRC 106333 / KACC 11606 / 5516J-15) TaxID=1223518 RepID=A0A511N1B5_DEIC1|nr:hypothetical protein [Deinococcus cellulosilyticus]GEM46673.1 hypothetical protein DC3_23080 [Deinococcus cellulosilyticus NBRC 106333 = KACC 11606]
MNPLDCPTTRDRTVKHLLDHTPLPPETLLHLRHCPDCQQHQQDLRQLIQALAFSAPQPPPADTKVKMLQRLHTPKKA